MIPPSVVLLLIGAYVYFLFGKVQIAFQSAILALLCCHKNTSQNATKKQDGTN